MNKFTHVLIASLLLGGLASWPAGATTPGGATAAFSPLLVSGTVMIPDSGGSPGNNLPGQLLSGVKDDITSQIEGILGEAEDDIMNGIKDIVTSMINTAISKLLDASPLASVEKLKQTLKEAHSKLQKVEYQKYKIEYQEKEVNTNISQSFADYYNEINLKGELEQLSRESSRLKAYYNNKLFSNEERASLKLAMAQVSSTDDILGDVKAACNQGGPEALWMSTAERMAIIDGAKKEIELRRQMIRSLRGQLSNVYAFRVQEMTHNTAVQGWFEKNSTLNRRIELTPKLY